jgi:hypothetical protein
MTTTPHRPQHPLPASKRVHFILDVRDCYEDREAAIAAAKAKEGFSEGYVFLYYFQPDKEFAPLVEAMLPDDDEEETTT